MGYTAKVLLDIARAEIGYCEKETNARLDDKTANAGDGNFTKYARDLAKHGYYQANKNGYAWCDMFVDHCHLVAANWDPVEAQRVICQTGPYGAGCKFSAQYYKEHGRFFADPQNGDQIFVRKFAHTGLVEAVENGKVHTIEGNADNMVKRCVYDINDPCIDGYGRPLYDAEEELSSAVTGTPSTGSDTDAKTIWDFLFGRGLNPFAVAGVMGNLYAESALKSDNLQNTGNKALGLSDAEYTAKVDAGSLSFEDGHGYGLAQWTYYTRKRALLAYARAEHKSVADLCVQLDFLWEEMQGYESLMSKLASATSVAAASDAFMLEFERPADQSDKAKTKRASYGQKYYDKYAVTAVPKKTIDQLAKEVIADKWGSGAERKQRLTAAGYDYKSVQDKVNEILSKKTAPAKRSLDEVAREVIQGKWGDGNERKRRLTAAGYNYKSVQKRVNKLLR